MTSDWEHIIAPPTYFVLWYLWVLEITVQLNIIHHSVGIDVSFLVVSFILVYFNYKAFKYGMKRNSWWMALIDSAART